MGKNRKRSADAVRLRQFGVILLLCCACAGVGIGYVYQKKVIYKLGREIKQQEIAVEESRRRTMLLEAQVAHLKSPAALEERVRAFQLNLVSPSQNQIIRVGAPAQSAAPQRPSQTTSRP
jgi:hypothetical protein